MRVLITGVTGFVGSHLLDYLALIDKVTVYGTKRPRSPLDNIHSPVKLIDADITDYHSVEQVMKTVQPDLVFHLASQSFVPLSWEAPRYTFEVNVIGTLNIIEAIRAQCSNAKVLFAGSSEEYGLVAPNECPITEEQPLEPLSPYAVSKVAGELLCRQYARSYRMHIVTTRAFNHTGPRRGAVFATSNFAMQIALLEKYKQEPVIYIGNLQAQRDFTDVRDMVQAYWLALAHCPPSKPFNICSGEAISIARMLDILLTLSTIKPKLSRDPSRLRPSDVPLLWGDCTKFKQLTGWHRTIPFEQTLKDLLDYWREKV